MMRTRTGLLAATLAVAALGVWGHAATPSQVADAAMRRDLDAVKTLLRQGADVNAAQGDGMTALHWAATNGDAAMTDVLLYAGANVKATSRLGRYNPLHVAVQTGSAPVALALLKRGAEASAATSTGATPLMFAAAADRADVIGLLVQAGAKPDVASKVVNLAAMASAMDFGGEPQAQVGGQARASQAPARPATAAGGRVIDVAGSTRPFRYNELIGAQGGLSALHYAARQGGFAAAKALVEHGANVNRKSPGDGTTPLLMAVLNGHFDMAKYFVEHGADPNIVSQAGAGALYATLNVQWAPKAAYPQPRDYLQQRTSYLELMTLLLDKGADPNARVNRKIWYSGYNFDQSGVDEAGATPFWRAAYASDVTAMRLLVKYGADPNIPSVRPAERTRGLDGVGDALDTSKLPAIPIGGPGVPVLQAVAGVGYGKGFAGNSHVFAPTGMMPAVKYLVEEIGVDVNAVDYEGNTVIHHAAARGDLQMIKYLVSKGAIVTTVNRAGQTTVDLANGPVQRVQPFPETIAYLESLGAKNNHKCVSC